MIMTYSGRLMPQLGSRPTDEKHSVCNFKNSEPSHVTRLQYTRQRGYHHVKARFVREDS